MQIALKQQKRLKIFLLLVCLALAIGSGTSLANAITRGYGSNDNGLRPGMVVALSPDSSSENPLVERASLEHINRVIGIATTLDDSLLTITSGNKPVYVETGGEVNAYVVNINGEVKKGDLLSLSPLKGILVKAGDYMPVLGIAVEDFAPDEANLHTIKDGEDNKDVLIDKIKINLDRKSLASLASVNQSSTLTRLGRAVVGKDVAELRVIVALILFFIVMIAEGGIIYGAVSSAISSLGRNPLAKGIIKHELIRVLVLAIAVLSLGVIAIYGILWV